MIRMKIGNSKQNLSFDTYTEPLNLPFKVGHAIVPSLVIQRDSYLNFPSVGSLEFLYIDISANKTYRWDEVEGKYFVVGSNYGDIKIINGGDAMIEDLEV